MNKGPFHYKTLQKLNKNFAIIVGVFITKYELQIVLVIAKFGS
jgi:hypothetical protein